MKRWTAEWIALSACGALVVAGSFGCGKAGDKGTEEAIEAQLGSGAEVDIRRQGDDVTVKIEGPDGDVEMTSRQDGDASTVNIAGPTGEMNIQSQDDAQSATMTISGVDGTMEMSTGEAAKLPEDMPADVPVYPGLTLTYVQNMGQQQVVFGGQTADPPAQVKAFYTEQAVAASWKETLNMEQGEPQPVFMMNWEKEKRVLSAVISAGENGTDVNVTYTATE